MKWTTPQWIRTLAAASVLAAVVLAVVLGSVFATVRNGLAVIGDRAAPQVSAATDLYFALSDMDAQLANVLLAGDDASLAADRKAALGTFAQRRSQADADLQQIATDASTQKSVRSVLDGVGQYESLASQVILLDQNDAAGRPAANVLDLHRQATDLMRTTLHTVDGITTSNHDLLNATYQSDVDGTVTARVWVIVIGAATVGLLVAAQVHLRRRLRRRLNPALLLATLVTAGFTITGVALLAQESGQLTVAKSNAFDSIVALSQARAISYDANADESRYLVDPGRAAQYQDAFLAKTQSLAGLSGATIDSYDAGLDSAFKAYQENNSDVKLTGFFGTELNNITFAGERGAAEQTVAAFQAYERDDRRIRALDTAGDLHGAIAFDVGTAAGQSNADFARYDAALKSVIDINQRAFDAAIGDGDGRLTGWTWQLPALAALLVAGLVVAGCWPRLAEYR
ncbi:hypothetical protein [Kutzneria buriramensis]|uniref:Uncharacterized protein n=1 Tax=Kutzneria buriramensis TaxID=1045776 RepID=A0A3E0HKG8_9PSEU|nr:hypothetical protein [Kutzneria buriramensis]REH46907.1 hypothetical protein BCF44_10671 [Kutzneria buriramensis]